MLLRETTNAKFFVDKFNSDNATDFKIDDSYKEEDSAVDVLLKDSHGRTIQIQNVAYRDGTIHVTGTSSIPDLVPVLVLGTAMSAADRTASIISCINSKKNKYPMAIVKDLILLVEVSVPSIRPSDIELVPKDIDFGFKGIYFVQLPYTFAAPDDIYGKEGYIFTLKRLELNPF